MYQSSDALQRTPRLDSDTDSDSESGWGFSAPHTPIYLESRPDDGDADDADGAELLSLAWLPPRQQPAEAHTDLTLTLTLTQSPSK